MLHLVRLPRRCLRLEAGTAGICSQERGRDMEGGHQEKPAVSCGNCSAIWRTKGTTNCWSEPATRPGRPENCPSNHHTGIVEEAFEELKGEGEDARQDPKEGKQVV